MRSRISCDTVGRYSKGIPAALSRMLRQEGPLVMYTGLGSSLAAIMPEAAITYGKCCRTLHCQQTEIGRSFMQGGCHFLTHSKVSVRACPAWAFVLSGN